MRISLKVLGYLWLGLFLIIGGLLFNAYSKLKPETFIALLTEQVQKNYPGTSLEVGKIDYAFSLDFNLNLQKIQLRRTGKLIASVGKVELKVPWWLLFTSRGNAQINLSHLDIFVDHDESHTIRAPVDETIKEIKVALPDYLIDARYTLRAKDVSIRDIHNSRRYFTVSKLLVREFQYGKNSAFELNIPIEITHGEVQYASNLWLFGDVTPDMSKWEFNYRGEFRTKEVTDKFQIEDLVIGGTAKLNPQVLDIDSEINLSIDKKSIGRGTLQASKDHLAINLDLNDFPLSYFGFMYEEIQNPYLSRLDGVGNGSIKLDKKFSSEVATVAGKLSFDGNFDINPTYRLGGKWQLSFQDSRWELSFMSPKAEVSFFRRSFIDLSKSKLKQYVEEIGFSGIDFYQAIQTARPLGQVMNELPTSYYSTTLSFKDCSADEKMANGTFKYGFTPDQRFYTADLKVDKTDLNLKYSSIKSSRRSLDLVVTDFVWQPSYLFLAPFYQAKHATVNGKIEGRWSEDWDSGTWLGNFSLNNGEAEQGLVPDLISKGFAIFDIKTKISKLKQFEFNVKNHNITITSLTLDKGDSGKLTGSLNATKPGKSFLSLSYPKNKKWKPVKKEIAEVFWKPKEKI